MRATVAGTSVRAQMSIYGITGVGFRLREVGIFNTTTTATAVALARMTNATGVGAGQTEGEYDENAPACSATVFAGHTADGTVGQILYQATLGASAGAGVIWTFGENGIICQTGTGNGLGVIIPTGTGQICDIYFVWDE